MQVLTALRGFPQQNGSIVGFVLHLLKNKSAIKIMRGKQKQIKSTVDPLKPTEGFPLSLVIKDKCIISADFIYAYPCSISIGFHEE